MNKPDYIHLLINPDNCTIALCKCKKENKDSIKVNWNSHREMEIYSKALLNKILMVNSFFENDNSYSFEGMVSDNKEMVLFDISKKNLPQRRE